jgi:threonine synthase
VAAAFRGIPGTRVVVLFPEGRVSPRQRRQLTAWGGNVLALCVRGDFDDCQRLVKQCFADSELREKLALTSANSINPGRLLPQLAYYGAASRRLAAQAIRPDFLVPSGNLGNGLSAVWARKLGFSIGEVTLVTNANRALADFYASGAWRPLATEATLASAMDVGDPSNLERLRALFWSVEELLAARVTTERVEDSGIRATIVEAYRRWGEFACPHTAAALAVWLRRPSDSRVVVATAHASKFEATVEPLLGGEVPLAESLRWILSRSERFETIEPDFAALKRRLLASSD